VEKLNYRTKWIIENKKTMPATIYTIHYETPEKQKIKKIIETLQEGGVILYPTDTGYSLGCKLSNKEAITKLRRIRQMHTDHPMTFLCYDISNISEYAKVENEAYKIIKRLTPGPYTFILPASKNVPKYSYNPKRKTSGIRIPDNRLCKALLMELGEPLICTSAKLPNKPEFSDPEETINAFMKIVDICVRTNEHHFVGESTVIDFTQEEYIIQRRGAGYNEVLGFIPDDF
jgi:tRNA threonylcarbamoyl adenosine modification protein (Sua5/YciO/YrdC/YwlC family)